MAVPSFLWEQAVPAYVLSLRWSGKPPVHSVDVVAAGSPSLDAGGPILMPQEEVLTFIEKAPGRVVTNHLEARKHCPTTRRELLQELEKAGLLSKTLIPADGEALVLEPNR